MSEINVLPAPLSLAEWRSAGEYFDFNGQRIFYRCTGEPSKPALLLIHGFPTARYGQLVGKQPVTELQGVGHYPQVEAPDLVLEAFRSFMRSC